MNRALKKMLPMAEAIERLLHPFAEVVIHDLQKDCIEAIYNPISKRDVGDDSYLDKIDFDRQTNVVGPYEKINWDGRKLKSISVIIRDDKAKAEGFLCINLDVSSFDSLQSVMTLFLGNNTPLSKEDKKLFDYDLHEHINKFVRDYCRQKQVALNSLSREEKKELVRLLESEGAFKGKNAAAYTGRILGISRATVYNYLNGALDGK